MYFLVGLRFPHLPSQCVPASPTSPCVARALLAPACHVSRGYIVVLSSARMRCTSGPNAPCGLRQMTVTHVRAGRRLNVLLHNVDGVGMEDTSDKPRVFFVHGSCANLGQFDRQHEWCRVHGLSFVGYDALGCGEVRGQGCRDAVMLSCCDIAILRYCDIAILYHAVMLSVRLFIPF